MVLNNMGFGNQDDEREKSRKLRNFLQALNRDSRQRIIREKRRNGPRMRPRFYQLGKAHCATSGPADTDRALSIRFPSRADTQTLADVKERFVKRKSNGSHVCAVLHIHGKRSLEGSFGARGRGFEIPLSGSIHSAEKAAEVSRQRDDDHGHSLDRQAVSGQDLFLVPSGSPMNEPHHPDQNS
jgi:hypothetical protein